MDGKKTVTVLLTRYHSTFSNFIYYVSGRGYTHASIAFCEDNEYYYSFSFKGFQREYPESHRNRDKKSICYRFEVSAEEYDRMLNKVKTMEKNREMYSYSRLGVLCCLFNISYRRKNHYFCSQFVAEILEMSEKIKFRKSASLYFPNQLVSELNCQSCLKEVVCNPL